jgi:hypothetical protein
MHPCPRIELTNSLLAVVINAGAARAKHGSRRPETGDEVTNGI